MMDGPMSASGEVRALAESYCVALHTSDWAALAAMCHDNYFMTSAKPGAGPEGEPVFFDKATFVERAKNRPPFAGEPVFEILSVDVENDEMASVKLSVDMPPRRFHDYLGFYRVDGEWKLITKLFRTVSETVGEAS